MHGISLQVVALHHSTVKPSGDENAINWEVLTGLGLVRSEIEQSPSLDEVLQQVLPCSSSLVKLL